VVASNPSVSSLASTASASTIYYNQPSVPRSIAASPGIASASISWQEPSNKGGSDVTYRVVSIPAAYDSGSLNSSTTSITATGLLNGTAYQFRVTVTNAGGFTNFNTSSSITTFNVPSAPVITGTQAVLSATLNWANAPANNGVSITQYRYSIDNGSTWTTFGDVNSSSVVATGVTADTTAYFVIQAYNSIGWGFTSNVIQYSYMLPSASITFSNPVVTSIPRQSGSYSYRWIGAIEATPSVFPLPSDIISVGGYILGLGFGGQYDARAYFTSITNASRMTFSYNSTNQTIVFDLYEPWYMRVRAYYAELSTYGGTRTYLIYALW
jgi:hypothetical protein